MPENSLGDVGGFIYEHKIRIYVEKTEDIEATNFKGGRARNKYDLDQDEALIEFYQRRSSLGRIVYNTQTGKVRKLEATPQGKEIGGFHKKVLIPIVSGLKKTKGNFEGEYFDPVHGACEMVDDEVFSQNRY